MSVIELMNHLESRQLLQVAWLNLYCLLHVTLHYPWRCVYAEMMMGWTRKATPRKAGTIQVDD